MRSDVRSRALDRRSSPLAPRGAGMAAGGGHHRQGGRPPLHDAPRLMNVRLLNVENELPTHSSAWRPRTHRVLQLTIFVSMHLHKGTESMPIISGLNGTRLGHGRCSSVGQRGRLAYERPSCSSTPCRWPAQLRRRRGRGGIRGALDWRGLRGRTSTSSHRRRPAGARGPGEAGERAAERWP